MSLISLAMPQPAVSCVYKWLDDQGYSHWLGIQFRPHVLFPDICLAAAAFDHARGGMYNLLEEADWGGGHPVSKRCWRPALHGRGVEKGHGKQADRLWGRGDFNL